MQREITVKGEEKRERVLVKALQLFNRHGIEYVGIREIAAALAMRPSHITYYFATKEDIILALAEQLRELNDRTLVRAEEIDSLGKLIDRFRQVMKNHLKYRCLPLSLPLLIARFPRLKAFHQQTQKLRKGELEAILANLEDRGELRELGPTERQYLIGSMALISRGWLAVDAITGNRPVDRIDHYLQLLKGHFKPFLNSGDQGHTTRTARERMPSSKRTR